MYALHDNGRKLFTSPQDCTPMQRFVYVMAKNEHAPDVDEDPEPPSGLGKANQIQQTGRGF